MTGDPLRSLLADRDQMARIAQQVVASGVGVIDTAAAAALGEALLAACPVRGDAITARAFEDVAVERQRQISQEGYTPTTDRDYRNGQLAQAAASYCLSGSGFPRHAAAVFWPLGWDQAAFKPRASRRDLVRGMALGIAAIENIDRRRQCPDCGALDGHRSAQCPEHP